MLLSRQLPTASVIDSNLRIKRMANSAFRYTRGDSSDEAFRVLQTTRLRPLLLHQGSVFHLTLRDAMFDFCRYIRFRACEFSRSMTRL